MFKRTCIAIAALAVCAAGSVSFAGETLTGKVTFDDGKPVHGAMVTAWDEQEKKRISVFTDAEGKYELPGLASRPHDVRARLLGYDDVVVEDVAVGGAKIAGPEFNLTKSDFESIQKQRRGVDSLSLIKFESQDELQAFRARCTYCHQTGTEGFRTPELKEDWHMMTDRMVRNPQRSGGGGEGQAAQMAERARQRRQAPAANNEGGNQQREQRRARPGRYGRFDNAEDYISDLNERLFAAFGDDSKLPTIEFEPPDPKSVGAVITEWPMGRKDSAVVHDLEIGHDGKIYGIDMANDVLVILDPKTGERENHPVPGGKDPETEEDYVKGPHSIEAAPNGDMWITMAGSGEMGKFVPSTKEWKLVPGGENGQRARYPHTLRFDQDGLCWYTTAGDRGVFRINTETYEVKYFGPGNYGIDVAPDGTIWSSSPGRKLIHRIDPKTAETKTYEAPFYVPRRLQLSDLTGMVWVPGFGSGVLGSFDPKTEKWTEYPLPWNGWETPYALSVHPKTGDVWVCGTSSDTMMRFVPDTKELTVYRMPSRVTYTREIEFDKDGNVWTCNSNAPARHIEDGHSSFIKIELKS